jgi:SRSO17 transposase
MPTRKDYEGMLADGLKLKEIAEKMISFSKGLLDFADIKEMEQSQEDIEEMNEEEEDDGDEDQKEGRSKKGFTDNKTFVGELEGRSSQRDKKKAGILKIIKLGR